MPIWQARQLIHSLLESVTSSFTKVVICVKVVGACLGLHEGVQLVALAVLDALLDLFDCLHEVEGLIRGHNELGEDHNGVALVRAILADEGLQVLLDILADLLNCLYVQESREVSIKTRVVPPYRNSKMKQKTLGCLTVGYRTTLLRSLGETLLEEVPSHQ